MATDAARLLDAARAAGSRLETRGRRIRQWADAARRDLEVLAVHHPATTGELAELADDLTHAAATHGRLHVVVLIDGDPDPKPDRAQTKEPPA